MLRKLKKCPNCKVKNHREVLFCYACGIEFSKYKEKDFDPYKIRIKVNYWSFVRYFIQFFFMAMLIASIMMIIAWVIE